MTQNKSSSRRTKSLSVPAAASEFDPAKSANPGSKPRKIGDQETSIVSKDTNISSLETSIVSSPSDKKSKPRKIGDKALKLSAKEPILVSVSSDDFRRMLRRVGMTQRDFSRFARTPYSTVRDWATGHTRIPGAALTVLALLAWDQALASRCKLCGWAPPS